MDQPEQVQTPLNYLYDCVVQTRQTMFSNVESTTNVVTNTNDEQRTIPPGYYTIGDIIVMLNAITHSPFSMYT